MTCFTPNQGFRSAIPTKNGKYGFTYSQKRARKVNGVYETMVTPCHKCEGCRYDYSREWAVKIMHEAKMNISGFSDNNSFITLTYSDSQIPLYGALQYKEHFVPFMKRLRKAIAPTTIRFYMIGEYGDLNLRPHYHAIIFGYNFPDKYKYIERGGNVLCRSPLLESLWFNHDKDNYGPFGYSSVGDVSYNSAAYVARYSMKKQSAHAVEGTEEYYTPDGELLLRPRLSTRYVRYHRETGDRIEVPVERAFMSNGGGSGKGGIGKQWFDQYAMTDMYSAIDNGNEIIYKDHTHMANGFVVRPPKYYDKLLEKINPKVLEDIKVARQDHLFAHADSFTPDVLRQRRECLLAKLSQKTRNIKDVYK